MEDVNEQRMKEYQELVDRWSKIYLKKLGDLFSLEELKQQAWLGILSASNVENASDRQGYLAQCIKHKIIDMIVDALGHQTNSSINFDIRVCSETEECLSTKQAIEKLKEKIKQIPHANFVLKHASSNTIREISELAKREGRRIGKTQVHNILKRIKEELITTIKEEE